MRLLPYAHQEDVVAWSDFARRKLVIVMLQVAQGRIRGEYVGGDFDLFDCRQTFMFETKRSASHWLVFRFLRDGIELISAGPEVGPFSAFVLAERRLQR